MNKKTYIIALLFFFIDLISKQIISHIVPINESIMIIKNFFYITYTKNTGAAWSILKDERILLLILTVIVLFVITRYINKEKLSQLEVFSYGMIIGGILGNFFDRLIFGSVIDFLDFYIFSYNYPIFNLADTFIVVGIILVIISGIRRDKYERNKK